jgi:hypothetical protein
MARSVAHRPSMHSSPLTARRVLRIQSDQLLKLTLPAEPLRVQVIPTPKSKREKTHGRQNLFLVLALSLVILIFSGALAILALIPEPIIDSSIPGISLAITYPRTLAIGDEGEIDLTATNIMAQPITGTIVLNFGPNPPVHLGEDSSNSMKMENFEQNASQTRHIRLQVAQMPWQLTSNQIEFTPTLVLDGQLFLSHTKQSIAVPPIPLLRLILTLLFGAFVFTIGLLREQIKKRLTG